MSEQHELQVGDTVQAVTQDAYNTMQGRVDAIVLPPPWLPEDQWGYEYWIVFDMECYQLTAPFMRHEVRRIETKESAAGLRVR